MSLLEKITYSVLLIDDNRTARDELCRCFERTEFAVKGVADDGIRGLELILEKKPDLVILDIIMPRLDGVGLLEKCAETIMPEDKPIIVVLSAFSDDFAIKTAALNGAAYYFVKPVEKELFIQRLRQIMDMKRSEENMIGSDEAIRGMIVLLLNEIGMPPHLKGYKYLLEASFLVFNDFDLLSSVSALLYPKIAKMYNTEPARVERDIRHAIDVSWRRGNLKGSVENGFLMIPGKRSKPSNVELVALITEKLRIEFHQPAKDPELSNS